MTPPTRQWGPLPRTPHQPKAKLRAAVKSSPTGPREARREAVPLDGRAQRSYPAQPRPHGPEHWVEKVGRSIKGSDTPQIVEGACRHLVKDRMDITGARWGLAGAEAILKLRAIITNGDFQEYWRFHLAKERHHVHEARYHNHLIPPGT